MQNIKTLEGPSETKNFREIKTKNENFEQSHSAEKCKRGIFLGFDFKLDAFGCVQNQVLSTFGKSA